MMLFKGFRSVAASLACATMILSPMAEGSKAEAQRHEQLKEFLKDSGFDQSNDMTVGEFYLRIKDRLPEKMQQKMRPWLLANRAQPMPKVDTSLVKDNKGVEQLRMLFTNGKESFSVTTGDGFVQFGSQKLTEKDFADPTATFSKVATTDTYFKKVLERGTSIDTLKLNSVPTAKEFASFTPGQRAQYFLQLRYLLIAAQNVMKEKYGADYAREEKIRHSYEIVLKWLTGEEAKAQDDLLPPGEIPGAAPAAPAAPASKSKKKPAQAKAKPAGAAAAPQERRPLEVTVQKGAQIPAPGERCIVAGYLTKYDERGGSCGGRDAGMADLKSQIGSVASMYPGSKSCGGGSYPCNPMVYGFQNSGSPYCISSGEVKHATATCNSRSELNGQGDYKNAKRIVDSWLRAQGKAGLRADKDYKLHPEDYQRVIGEVEKLNAYIDEAMAHCTSERGAKISEKRGEQGEACEALRQRKLGIAAFMLTAGEGDGATRCAGIPGASFNPASKRCECATTCAPPVNRGGRDSCEAPRIIPIEPVPVEKEETEEAGTNWWPWIAAAGAGVLVSCIVWWCKDKKRPPVYIPPAITPPTPLPPPTPQPPTPPPPTVTPPVVVPPTTPATEYPTTTTPAPAPINSGGTR